MYDANSMLEKPIIVFTWIYYTFTVNRHSCMGIFLASTVYFWALERLYAGLLFKTNQLRWVCVPHHHGLWHRWCTHTFQLTYTHGLEQIDCNSVTAGPNVANSHSWWNILCLLSSKCPAKSYECVFVLVCNASQHSEGHATQGCTAFRLTQKYKQTYARWGKP